MPEARANSAALVCAGEFFFDIIFHGLKRLPRLGQELLVENCGLTLGGGAVITATVASRLLRRCELVTVLGNTALDAFAVQELDRRGVGRSLVRVSRKHAMSGLTVSVSTAQDRYFLTANGANKEVADYVCERAVQRELGRAQHVHFGLSPRSWRKFPALIAGLRQRGVLTSWDLGWRPEAIRDADCRRTLALVDVIFMNESEALRFTRTESLGAALRRLRRGAQAVVVKLGARGAAALDADGRRFRSPGLKVRAMDTTGAGDAFNGGFLHLWLQGADMEDCLRAGNVCGALSTRAAGGTAAAPTPDELRRLMRRAN